MEQSPKNQPSLIKFAWLSIAAAVFTIGLKAWAYLLTGSVGLLSDAVESIVNLVGAVVALTMLTIASRPADEEHNYGHSKAEYFSSGIEGTLILIAALSIAGTAVQRLIFPKPIEQIGLGLAVSAAASTVNLIVGLVISRAAKRSNSITLEANAKHLMTDVWTSVGVIVGVGAVALTGWERLDPVVAILVAVNIIWAGFQIVRKSVLGLMDTGLSAEQQTRIQEVLEGYRQMGVEFHALRTRQAGARAFVSFHVLAPGDWTIQRGHDLLEKIELDLRTVLPNINAFTHLESLTDPVSWEDTDLDRPLPPASESSEGGSKLLDEGDPAEDQS
ncbi:MAG: cation diffusion facilitator family transporter [Anaerolineales bacterium]|nr:cation diffusion facilitator family transporter [Anaerolineales bacterium]